MVGIFVFCEWKIALTQKGLYLLGGRKELRILLTPAGSPAARSFINTNKLLLYDQIII